ncbi:hypothetical protein GFS31_04410 [Leptolyngbya sp. BL0902]|nr:hypothetical protein GFS31_04410 [Leptolyngbya sp. BL0902]
MGKAEKSSDILQLFKVSHSHQFYLYGFTGSDLPLFCLNSG